MGDLYTDLRSALPPSYVAFIESHNGWEGDLGDLFGSNGGGEMLCFDLPSRNDRVFWIPNIGMSDDEAMLRYDSFAEVAAAITKRAEPGAAP